MRTVRTEASEEFELVRRRQIGTQTCPGEAHSNPFIDNCLLCAPGWGEVPLYAALTPADCVPGVAVPCAWVAHGDRAFEAAEGRGEIVMISVSERRGRGFAFFNVWIAPTALFPRCPGEVKS